MNGRALFEKIKGIKPHLSGRFLFVTGFAAGEDDDDFLETNHLPYLLKPFNQDSLIQAVEAGLKALI